MKSLFSIGLMLLVFINVNAQKNENTRDTMVGKYFEKGAEVDSYELVTFAEFEETIKLFTGSPSNCEYVMKMKKYFTEHDFVFDQLQLYQKADKTIAHENDMILQWVTGRTQFHMAVNKVAEIYKCMTADELKEDIRTRILETLKGLGNISAYIDAAKKYKTLTATSTAAEICDAVAALKKESDKIEPYLEKLAILYVAEPTPANLATRTVDFADPKIAEFAEKILNFRSKQFLPRKEEIKGMLAKYNCN